MGAVRKGSPRKGDDMKKKIMIGVSILVFLLALVGTLFPMISDYWNTRHQSEVQVEYEKQMESMEDSELTAALEAANAYNAALRPVRYTKAALDAAAVGYDHLLNLYGNGIMAYVEIPRIHVNLPIYHGTTTEVLEKGIGHLTGSSLPIGGVGNHAVLTGHSGVAGQRLFSDLDQLEIGDVFFIRVLNQQLAYEVRAIDTVLPEDTKLLTSVDGKDKCTLVTCTPFGVNTHRLLVQGERIEYETAEEIAAQTESVQVGSTWETQYIMGLKLGAEILGFLVVVVLAVLGIRKMRRNGHD